MCSSHVNIIGATIFFVYFFGLFCTPFLHSFRLGTFFTFSCCAHHLNFESILIVKQFRFVSARLFLVLSSLFPLIWIVLFNCLRWMHLQISNCSQFTNIKALIRHLIFVSFLLYFDSFLFWLWMISKSQLNRLCATFVNNCHSVAP